MKYPARESKTLEFKERITDLHKIIKTCVAFANDVGGEIVIGVEDQTRDIIGLDEKSIDELYEKIPSAVFDSITPTIIPEVFIKNFGSSSVLIIRINPGFKKPYYIQSEGIPKGIYIRVGPHTRVATESYIEELVASSKGQSYDHEGIKTDPEFLYQSELIHKLLGKNVTISQLTREGILFKDFQNTKMVSRAAILAFHPTPEILVPEAQVICTLFKGVAGRNILQTFEITGPLSTIAHQSLMQTLSFIERNYQLKTSEYKGRSPIPEVALREAIINALIHRKYNIAGSVKIAVYDNRVEIFSPGCFPSTISPQNIGDGSTFLRNPLLAKFARKLKLIEKLGSGIPTIIRACKKAGLKPPDFSENGDFVKVIFWFAKQKSQDISIEDLIFTEIQKHGTVKVETLIHLTSVSRNTITNHLNKLIQKKKIIRKGKGRGVVYILKE